MSGKFLKLIRFSSSSPELVLDLKNDKVFVGDDSNAECTLIMEDETMVSLGNGTLTTQEALAQNKLEIEGNLELALKLAPFVSSL